MKPPLFVRPLGPEERLALEQGLASRSAFTLRRCQALLQSADGFTPRQIQAMTGISDQSVRNAIRAFHQAGLAARQEKKPAPPKGSQVLPDAALTPLKELLHQRPRQFGLETSLWTLEKVAQVAAAQGITPRRVSDEPIRAAMKRLKVGWKRAKRWITSPDPEYRPKKGPETG